jgi:Retroviral aspartyl protease
MRIAHRQIRWNAKNYSEDDFYLLRFLSGLKSEIADAIELHTPQTLKQAFQLARQIERSFASQYKRHNTNYKQPQPSIIGTQPSVSNNSTQPSVSTPLSLDHKKALRLCFKCNEKFYKGHKYSSKELHIMCDQESDALFDTHGNDAYENSILERPVNSGAKQAIYSISDPNGCSSHKSMQFMGYIDQMSIIALIDSGSMYSFINPGLLLKLFLTPKGTSPLTVETATGELLTSTAICPALQFQLQNHALQGDFRVLKIKGYDLILVWIGSLLLNLCKCSGIKELCNWTPRVNWSD